MPRLRAAALGRHEGQAADGATEPTEEELREAEATAATQHAMQEWADDGLRTLAFAYKPLAPRRKCLHEPPADLADLGREQSLRRST